MERLVDCGPCGGFVPPGEAHCPCCEAPVQRSGRPPWLRRAAATACGGAIAAVLAACYGSGAAYCDAPSTDRDHDGYCGGLDCNEADATIHDGAADELGDGIDQNCDGVDGYAGAGGGGGGTGDSAAGGAAAGGSATGGAATGGSGGG